jgi:hypothetical protein
MEVSGQLHASAALLRRIFGHSRAKWGGGEGCIMRSFINYKFYHIRLLTYLLTYLLPYSLHGAGYYLKS